MAIYSGGKEFLVNTETASNQWFSTITSLASGGFVISWMDHSGQGGDASGSGIKAQIFDASCAKIGSEFLVNTAIFSFQQQPTITSLSTGGFVVSWTDLSGKGADTSISGVKAQIFDASGAKVGPEFLVNTETMNFQGAATIASLSSGAFVVSWLDNSGEGGDASDTGIKAQMYDTSGTRVGSEFLVNTATLNSQTLPAITSLSSGGFVITWEDYSGQGGDDASGGIKGQLFDASGAMVGPEFLVNTETVNLQATPAITSLSSGGFVVSWMGLSDQGSSDTSSYNTKAQIFDGSGAKLGEEFLVNTAKLNSQTLPAITSLSTGGFVISWEDGSGRGGDASLTGIKAQIFDASGAKVGSEFLVNISTVNSQGRPAMTPLSSGAFGVSWTDGSGQGGDASGYSIKARIFSPGDEINTISGTTGNDSLVGTEGADLIWTLPGDDTLLGNGGNDQLRGGQGSDTLLGHGNDDELYGGGGDDVIRGGEGNDLLDGYSGDDKLIDLLGDNVFDTGSGNDRVEAGAGDDQFLFRAINRGDDTVIGFGNGDDLVPLIGTKFADFADVLAAGEDTAAGWRLQIDNDTSVTLHGIIEAQLVAEDFALAL